MEEGQSVTFRIHGKGDKWREVYLWKVASAPVLAWYSIRVSQGARPSDPLIISYRRSSRAKGLRLTANALDAMVKQYCAAASVRKPKISMHMFRASHAFTLRHIQGYDSWAIAERLGHANISTTDRYVSTRGRLNKTYASLAAYWREFKEIWERRNEHDADAAAAPNATPAANHSANHSAAPGPNPKQGPTGPPFLFTFTRTRSPTSAVRSTHAGAPHTQEVTPMTTTSDNRAALDEWFSALLTDFGSKSGEAIIKSFIAHCGGLRITVPSREDLTREERDRRIRALFNGRNYSELAERFTNSKGDALSVRQIRYIIDGDRASHRSPHRRRRPPR